MLVNSNLTNEMRYDDIFKKIQNYLAEEYAFEESEMLPTTHLETDLGLDSMDQTDLCLQLEDKFDISFTDADLQNTNKTLDGLTKRVLELLSELVEEEEDILGEQY